jgi:hypothetical protein
LLLVVNVAETMPDSEGVSLEPAQPRCCPACRGVRLVYRELLPAQPAASAVPDTS